MALVNLRPSSAFCCISSASLSTISLRNFATSSSAPVASGDKYLRRAELNCPAEGFIICSTPFLFAASRASLAQTDAADSVPELGTEPECKNVAQSKSADPVVSLAAILLSISRWSRCKTSFFLLLLLSAFILFSSGHLQAHLIRHLSHVFVAAAGE